MATKRDFVDADFICHVCSNVFDDPVMLPCGHSGCRNCVENHCRTKGSRECPLCGKVSTNLPLPNLALRNLCQGFLDHKNRLDELCKVHNEKFILFCCDDKQLVCALCVDSDEHKSHTCRPISEVAEKHMRDFQGKYSLFLVAELTRRGELSLCDDNAAHIKRTTSAIESLIKKDFEKLHQLLDDQEKAMIEELQQEKQQNLQFIKDKLKKLNEDVNSLSKSNKDMKRTLKSGDIRFLQTFEDTLKRVKDIPQVPKDSTGKLIDHAKYIGNLKLNVWRKIRESLSYTPVVLDPNTRDRHLALSDDLTEVWNPNGLRENYSKHYYPLPSNSERFEIYPCVLGSVGFTTGTHSWDVDVGENSFWMVGVTVESVQRKGIYRVPKDIWTIGFDGQSLSVRSPPESRVYLSGYENPKQVRVKLDMSEGQVSFSDPQSDVVYYTLTHHFEEKVFPFFHTVCSEPHLKILPVSKSFES